MSNPETIRMKSDLAEDGAAEFMAEYARVRNTLGVKSALAGLQVRLNSCPASHWVASARALIDEGAMTAAADLLIAAGRRFPTEVEIGYWLANVFRMTAHYADAEALLHALIGMQPAYADTHFLLAETLKEQGKLSAAARSILVLLESCAPDIETTLTAVKFLDACGRAKEAAKFCEKAIARGASDSRLYAHAGRYALQCGQFDIARERYLHVLRSNVGADEWHIPQALASAQRYASTQHPDFLLFSEMLQNRKVSYSARASTLFALGKAFDDVGDYARATSHLREANALVNREVMWSREDWQRTIEEKIRFPMLPLHRAASHEWTPVFIVGLPRSGTTLVEERLARHPDITARGELAWIPFLAHQLLQPTQPVDSETLHRAAAIYSMQVRQDDQPTHWYVDKQPLNFLHLDVITALFPNAKVIYCERNIRDTALSIWSQYFAGGEGNFAYDFENIAWLARGCARIMAHWRRVLPIHIHCVDYSQMVQAPEQTIAALQTFLGAPTQNLLVAKPKVESAISTSSMWQARQPIYHYSVNRWQAYAAYLPELIEFFPNDA